MAERLLVVLVFAAAVTLAVIIVRRWNRRRVRALTQASAALAWGKLRETPDGRRTLVTFSTPSCAACHAAQAPAVKAVEAQLGSSTVRVNGVDTARRPAAARACGGPTASGR